MKKVLFCFLTFFISSLFPHNSNNYFSVSYKDVLKYSAVGAVAFVAGFIVASKFSGSSKIHSQFPNDYFEVQSIGQEVPMKGEPAPHPQTIEEYDRIVQSSLPGEPVVVSVSGELMKQLAKRERKQLKAERARRNSKRLENRFISESQAKEKNYSFRRESFSLNSYALEYAKKLIPERDLQNLTGNEVQINIHKEVVETLNEASLFLSQNKNIFNQENYLKMIFGSADIALEYSDQKNYERAYSFSDLCRGLFDIISAPAEGIARGISNFSDSCMSFLDCFLTDPVGMARNFIASFFQKLYDFHVDMDKAMFPQNYYSQKDARKAHQEDIHKQFLQNFAQLKSYITKIKNNPRESAVEAFAYATEFVLSFGLFDVGFIKARNFAKAVADGIRCEAYGIVNSSIARAPLLKIIEEAGEIAEFALEKPLTKTNTPISCVPREKLLVKVIKDVKRYPNSIRIPKNHFAETVKKLMQFEEIFSESEISKQIRELIKKSKPSTKNTAAFQREVVLDDGYIYRFRRDIGSRGHPIRKYGYKKPVDHYNIEIIKKTLKEEEMILAKHIIVDENKNIIAYYCEYTPEIK
jgi:hypothetical protein